MKYIKNLGFLFLGLLLILLVFSFTKKGIYSKELGLNLLVVSDLKVSVAVFRPSEGVTSWIDLPSNLVVKVYKTGVQYPAISLFELGKMERDAYNHVTKSISQSMGVSLPRMIYVGKESSPESLIRALGGLLTQTNLEWRDRVLLRRELANVLAARKIVEIDIPPNVLEKVIEPDGKEVTIFNAILPMWNKNKFLMEQILGESANVKVTNRSEIKGVGATISRQLESAGVRVTEVTSEDRGLPDQNSGGCFFMLNNDSMVNLTKTFMTNHLDCKQIKTENIEMGVGEIVVGIY